MKKTLTFLMASLLSSIATTSFADEVWDTNLGKVTYIDERGSTAVWSYNDNGRDGLIFIPGLAKVYTGRESYDGYWAQDKSNHACDTKREGLNGKLTVYWGRFHIDFIDPDFPSRWQAKWSYCDKEPANKWNGTPVVNNSFSTQNDTNSSFFTEEIRFAKGTSSTVIENSIIRGETAYYHFTAKAGQMLDLSLSSVENNAVFAIYTPNYKLIGADEYVEVEGEALNGASVYDQATEWVGELPTSGKYLIAVGATRGNASFKFKMSIK